ncbi:MFS multidrug transporter-like protein [Amylocarpus encephaloides]|uniref:MFS multidrug transporter-like protein n=1 Tax=Amylocarpus encephaloides TaxID=45428 RepID=A0A9P8C3N1_9HELO|nr:MFS multidrug transporter-like protein [Amylocarpus encephaloides]
MADKQMTSSPIISRNVDNSTTARTDLLKTPSIESSPREDNSQDGKPITKNDFQGVSASKHETETSSRDTPPEVPSGNPPGEDYSVLTVPQKRMVVFTASVASVFSPMATSIYYPSLEIIAKDLGVSNSQISLTVTLFLVIQGIAPSFIADLADRSGRRPMYIVCFILFNAANIGLALQNNFVALLILRMLQAGGSSGTIALANGVVGDTITSSERGQYIAYSSFASIFGVLVAPILGGAIAQYAGWHFVFWFLFIFSCVVNIPLILFFPETCRRVVDNGSIPPPFLSRNITDNIRHKNRAKAGLVYDEEKAVDIKSKYRFSLPNPFSTLKVLLDLESALVLVATGLCLGNFYATSTASSKIFFEVYNFNQLQVSLMFIPLGGGSILAAFTAGIMVDQNYRRHATRLGIPIVRNRAQDLTDFPIEKARLQVAFPVAFISGAAVIGFGWSLVHKTSLAGPVITMFVAGWGLTCSVQVLNVLLVDLFPGKPSVATAANNLVRCEIGAVFTAVIVPLIDAVGTGWAFTILSLISVAFNPVLLILMRKGPEWRKQRKAKEEKARSQKEEKSKKRDMETRR